MGLIGDGGDGGDGCFGGSMIFRFGGSIIFRFGGWVIFAATADGRIFGGGTVNVHDIYKFSQI
jgi:hypothetical protein